MATSYTIFRRRCGSSPRRSAPRTPPGRSVKTITREGGGKRKLSNRLTDDQVRELVTAFEAGTTRVELAKRYGIGRTSVAKLLREWRERKAQERMV
ncbi:MAG: hypothetical protein ACRDSL_22330 [Pseudonocardiaceae bacterium]